MKIIDLLNKIANGEEVPKRIRYKGDCWYLKQNYTNRLPYYSNGYDKDNLFTGEEEDYFSHSLNDEVEVLEDKKIDILPMLDDEIFITSCAINQTRRKINEIIDYINKGDK